MAEKTVNEIDIWAGVINPSSGDMSAPEAAALLRWGFNDHAKKRMEQLATRNNQGALSGPEKEELEAYVQVGQVIGILQAKARLSLKHSAGNGSD
ncbi:MAG: hypothetical protein RIC55_08695 [Pirellulaceae bacterium]